MNWTGWLPAFLMTLAVETPVYALTLRRSLGVRVSVATAIALNSTTHPLAWLTITSARHPFPVVFLSVEGAVWLLEALLLALMSHLIARHREALLPNSVPASEPTASVPVSPLDALAVSFAANGLSAGLGLLL